MLNLLEAQEQDQRLRSSFSSHHLLSIIKSKSKSLSLYFKFGRNQRRRNQRRFFFGLIGQFAFTPGNVNYREEQQFEKRGSNDSANHRRGNAFHYVGAGLECGRPHDRQEAKEDRADRHDLRSNPLHRAFHDRVVQIFHGVYSAVSFELVPGMIEIEQHDHTGFGADAGESDESNPDADAHVVAEKKEQPKGADE